VPPAWDNPNLGSDLPRSPERGRCASPSTPRRSSSSRRSCARKRAGLTQRALADRIEKPQSFVPKYERGERWLDVVEFVMVAKAIGNDPAALVKQLAERM
jgi:hypothetical protein